jgi:putative endonuclease
MKFKRSGKFYVYIVECCDGSYYTGYTPNIENRLKLHNAGRGARYTRDRRPVKLVWLKEYKYFKRAFKEELRIKRFSRVRKENLVKLFKHQKRKLKKVSKKRSRRHNV